MQNTQFHSHHVQQACIYFIYLKALRKVTVIVPAQTHVATAHAVEIVGAKPVFVDCELKTGNINTDKIEEKISNRTKAIAVVHFFGIPVDMEKILKIAKKYKLLVLEDCALAVGSKIKKTCRTSWCCWCLFFLSSKTYNFS